VATELIFLFETLFDHHL